MMRAPAGNPPSLAPIAASPAVLAFALALLASGWRDLFLALLLIAGLLMTLPALPRCWRRLAGKRKLALPLALALSPLLPLAAGLLLLALTRLALVWTCRFLPEREVAFVAPGLPLLDAALIGGAALALVSVW